MKNKGKRFHKERDFTVGSFFCLKTYRATDIFELLVRAFGNLTSNRETENSAWETLCYWLGS